MQAPLAGVKVIELARILAGPWAGQTLADLGADVIKVEAPEGDDTRRWGPPFIERDGDKTAAYFYAANRGKRSITCDFRTPEGQALVRRLVAELCIPTTIIGMPTQRAEDGLALSSRNGFLTAAERAQAPLIYQTLRQLQTFWDHQNSSESKTGRCPLVTCHTKRGPRLPCPSCRGC